MAHPHEALSINPLVAAKCCGAMRIAPCVGVSMTDTLAPTPMMLTVSRCGEIAKDIHMFELRAGDTGALPPATAGAHISVRTPGGFVRKYSLTNDLEQTDRYCIAVKRESLGRGGSVDLIDKLREGDTLECSLPRNDFALVPRATQFIFIAGGIGITPIMAMLRRVHSMQSARFRLYYCTRDIGSTAFRDELSAPDYRDHVVMHHDSGDPSRALDLWPILERPVAAHVYCCGPRPMLEAVRDMTGHWSASAIHFESFVDAAATHVATDKPFRVRLAKTGVTLHVDADQSILDAIRAAGIEVPSSCEAGTCGTCRTSLLAGKADHRDLVLAEDEREHSLMICVSRALSDEIVIDR